MSYDFLLYLAREKNIEKESNPSNDVPKIYEIEKEFGKRTLNVKLNLIDNSNVFISVIGKDVNDPDRKYSAMFTKEEINGLGFILNSVNLLKNVCFRLKTVARTFVIKSSGGNKK